MRMRKTNRLCIHQAFTPDLSEKGPCLGIYQTGAECVR
jgi:hypothetical protein